MLTAQGIFATPAPRAPLAALLCALTLTAAAQLPERWHLAHQIVDLTIDEANGDTAIATRPIEVKSALQNLLPEVGQRRDAHRCTSAFFSPFYTPSDDMGTHMPANAQSDALRRAARARSKSRTGDQARQNIDKSLLNLEQMRQNRVVNNPQTAEIAFSQIPEPWKELQNERRTGQERNSGRSLARVFAEDYNMDSDNKMHKPPEKEKSPWTFSGEENLQISQLFLNNWAKGGESSVTLSSDLRAKAIYKSGRSEQENELVHKVGLTHSHALGTRVSDDAFNISSKYGFNAVTKWYYSFLYTLKTQLCRNYNSGDIKKENPKSKLFSPAYMQFTLGMDYKKDNLSLLLSPYTCALTIVTDTAVINPTKFGVEAGHRHKALHGFSITSNWKKKLAYNVEYSTKFELFYEYLNKQGSKRFDWENIISVQINRFLTTRLLAELRYYENELRKFQFKENYTISFKYKF